MAKQNGKQNGKARLDKRVRVALVGVGNCANSLLQGVEYYKDAPDDKFVPGLMHVNLGGYHISDIEFTAAFDVTKDKVGKDLADAIWAHPNDTIKFAEVPKTGIAVSRGMTHDGLGKYISEVVTKAEGPTDDVVGILKETGTDVVVNYLPVGSEAATKWYAEQILEAGCAMVNCMPVFLAREQYWQGRFEERGLPIIGDDIKSQVGATITHRVLTSLFRERGVHLDKTMQLNVGGNSDFLNMLERERLESKKISKTNAVTSMLDYDLGEGNVHVGPSDYVPWLTDRKWAYIRMEGSSFGDVPLYVVSTQDLSHFCLTRAIVAGELKIGECAGNTVARSIYGGHYYSNKAPGMSLLAVPAAEAVRLPDGPKWNFESDPHLWGVRVLTSGLGFLLCVFLIGRIAEGVAPGTGAPALVAFGLGTLMSSFAATGFDHDLTAAFGFGAFVLAWARRPGLAGLAAGAAYAVEYQAVAIIVLVALYVALRGLRPVGRYAAGVVPGVAVSAAYSWAAFGAPWRNPHSYLLNSFADVNESSGVLGVNFPTAHGIRLVFVGDRGLLVEIGRASCRERV